MAEFRHLIITRLTVQILCRLILSFTHPVIQSSTHYIIIMCILYGLGGQYYFDYQYDRGDNYVPRFHVDFYVSTGNSRRMRQHC